MKLTIIYPADHEDFEERRFEYDADASNVHGALEAAFRDFQRIDGRGGTLIEREGPDDLRSLSVGDMAFGEGRWFIVDRIGWKEVFREFAQRWRRLPFRDRLMGVDYCVERGRV